MQEAKPYSISKKAVIAAYQKVKANKGTYGVDEQSIEDFERKLNNNLYKIWNRMSSGTYFPQPVKAVAIPKKKWRDQNPGNTNRGGQNRPDGSKAVF